MNTASKIAVVFGLVCVTSGCGHKTKATPPQAAQAPIASPAEVAKGTPPPQLPPAKPLDVKPPAADPPQEPPPPAPHKTKRKTKPQEAAPEKDSTAAQGTSQQASAGEPPEMSPIGQLSSTGTSNGTPSRHQIQDLIDTTQNGLNALTVTLKRDLTAEEKVTAAQIRTFLDKAKQALSQDDLDGANTLATKAKVLMDELTKS